MDRVNSNSESLRGGSFGRTSSGGSSVRRRSLSLSGAVPIQIEDDIESESVSEAGDIGDRALHSNRYSNKGSFRSTIDNAVEKGMLAEDTLYGFGSRNSNAVNPNSLVLPLPEGDATPRSIDDMVSPYGKIEDDREGLPRSMEYIATLVHLAVFGILGVLTRYLLQKLFGPGVADVTNDRNLLYLDLPSNMVGSFLMGWLGVVFKGDILSVSEYLAIGLSTGYLGSLTTFSGWNQKMLDLSVDGEWVISLLGFLLGLFLVAYSIIFGVETAQGFRWLLTRAKKSSKDTTCGHWRVDSYKCHMYIVTVLLLILCLLLAMSGILVEKNFDDGGNSAQLWIACLVAAPGVWVRWFLARLNGRGLGKAGLLKWIPFGTLIANVSAACIMAALATTKKAVNTSTCNTVVNGIQFGLLGCLSTVSTFMAEFHAMRQSIYPWRAYAYATLTIVLSFGLGILLYSLPVWTKGYN